MQRVKVRGQTGKTPGCTRCGCANGAESRSVTQKEVSELC